MVLQRAGDDLGGRGRAAIDEHHQRQAARQITVRLRLEAAIVLRAAAADRDDLALVEEIVADGDRLVEQPARIVAQVEDDAGELVAGLALQRLYGAFEPVAGALAEIGDSDIADVAPPHVGLYRLDP